MSLTRDDVAFGDNHSFNNDIWNKVMEAYGQDTSTNFDSVSKARYDRVQACKMAHAEAKKGFNYGVKEFILSYGESALFLGILGSPDEGKIPLEYLRVLFRKFFGFDLLRKALICVCVQKRSEFRIKKAGDQIRCRSHRVR